MAINYASNTISKPMVGFCYFSFFKACFFAGLFRRSLIPILSGV